MNPFLIPCGQTISFTSPSNRVYKISAELFEKHDHEKWPVYFLEYPLQNDKKLKYHGAIVVTVECDPDEPPYPSPYTGIVESEWGAFRSDLILIFGRIDAQSVECRVQF